VHALDGIPELMINDLEMPHSRLFYHTRDNMAQGSAEPLLRMCGVKDPKGMSCSAGCSHLVPFKSQVLLFKRFGFGWEMSWLAAALQNYCSCHHELCVILWMASSYLMDLFTPGCVQSIAGLTVLCSMGHGRIVRIFLTPLIKFVGNLVQRQKNVCSCHCHTDRAKVTAVCVEVVWIVDGTRTGSASPGCEKSHTSQLMTWSAFPAVAVPKIRLCHGAEFWAQMALTCEEQVEGLVVEFATDVYDAA
jgi:hypothetical protein